VINVFDKKSNDGHGWMMLFCFVAMLGSIWFFWGYQGEEGSSWAWLFLLLCPLMHIFMMKGHMGHNDDDKDDSQDCH
jgi:hypothetical protein